MTGVWWVHCEFACLSLTTREGGIHGQDCVTYYAISGATQTGPNIFWSLAALKYASVSGNITWLKQRMPHLRLALSFLLNSYNKEYNLLRCAAPACVGLLHVTQWLISRM